MSEKSTETRLCPHCANSIQEDAASCPYCKGDLSSGSVPQWLKRDEARSDARIARGKKNKFLIAPKFTSIPPKFIWPAAMILVALIAFLAGAYTQRSRSSLSSDVYVRQLQAKDQMIQSQQAELAQIKQQLDEKSNQLAQTKTNFEESQKKLSAVAAPKADRPNRSEPPTRTASRAPNPANSAPPPAAGAKRTVEPGVYETTRATSVYENPSSSSRVLSQIGRGTKINVVSSTGGWLEVRSRRGNPPGYVRSDDARLVGRPS
jgi:hypothetical protein